MKNLFTKWLSYCEERLTLLAGKTADKKASKRLIPLFNLYFNIDTKRYITPKSGYLNLNDWFRRDLNPEFLSKGNTNDPRHLISPCESFLRIQEKIDPKKLFQVKGQYFSLENLIDNSKYWHYSKGAMAIFRLHPSHYHCVHHIDDGTIISHKKLYGTYHPVNSIGLKVYSNLFCNNRRDVSEISTENFGLVTYVEIGAFNVGSIVQADFIGNKVTRNRKKSYFQFGGSTVILLFEPGKVLFNEEYKNSIKKEIYTPFGKIIGKKSD